MTRIKVSCPGSCGELFQCVVGGRECLLSYGIDQKSYLSLVETGKSPEMLGQKMSYAMQRFSGTKNLLFDAHTDLPIGKGCSSSTADILVGIKLLSLVEGRAVSAEELTKFCTTIEPSDSVAFAHWTVLNPLTGEVVYQTNWQPHLWVYILEPADTVDTLTLPRMTETKAYPAEKSEEIFRRFIEACEEENIVKLGQVATLSARLNQQRLPKPYLEDIITIAEKQGAIGVNVAHSGTVLGILLPFDRKESIAALEEELARHPLASYYQERKLSPIIFEGLRQIKE
ncbi:GHMP family kinase ATP-binding protein [Streptococcus himalayensis]|uniref:Kinase n=1 Tax=Streptococcus himalayensis TaxID=1888195 RepID=A0A917A8U1_9STRE|nr:kinase [Streptococcus himalayensis]GGE33441.1 kinase [Streptococcus himalayensis]